MAKRKRPRKLPQARHRKKSKASRHDKRNRLRRANSQRVPTREASVPLTGAMAVTVASMAALLDVRSAFRLPIVFAGAMLAGGRRTASRWFRAAGVGDDWDRFYDLLPQRKRRRGEFSVRRCSARAGEAWPVETIRSTRTRWFSARNAFQKLDECWFQTSLGVGTNGAKVEGKHASAAIKQQ